jgi:glycosyltransferase involved in cell wall biosynthesis
VNIAVGILTHNLFKFDRVELFKQTVRSLKDAGRPFRLYIVDNGSTDETGDYVRSFGGTILRDRVHSCGHGMNATISICAESGADLVVFSNDDIIWHPGAFAELEKFWSEAPDDVLIAAGLLEAEYPWNTPRERIEAGGVAALVRDTAPGGAWTLRAKDWSVIGPVPEAPGWDDVPTCNRLRTKGYRVCQIDLADHVGEKHSTWGNISNVLAKPLDRKVWNV